MPERGEDAGTTTRRGGRAHLFFSSGASSLARPGPGPDESIGIEPGPRKAAAQKIPENDVVHHLRNSANVVRPIPSAGARDGSTLSLCGGVSLCCIVSQSLPVGSAVRHVFGSREVDASFAYLVVGLDGIPRIEATGSAVLSARFYTRRMDPCSAQHDCMLAARHPRSHHDGGKHGSSQSFARGFRRRGL